MKLAKKGEEIWVDIKGYEGLYQISNFGNVRSLNFNHTHKNKLRKKVLNRGYYGVILYKDGKVKKWSIHRLVALHFVSGYKEGLIVHHKDENPLNNHYTNLQWCTHKQNANFGTRNARLSKKAKGNPKYKKYGNANGNFGGKSPQAVPVICTTTGKIFPSIMDAVRFYNLSSDSGIHKSCRNNKYSSGKCPITGKKMYWRYITNERRDVE